MSSIVDKKEVKETKMCNSSALALSKNYHEKDAQTQRFRNTYMGAGGGAFAQTILLIPTIETILSTIKGTWDPLGNTERKSKPWTVRSAGGIWKYGGVYQTWSGQVG